MAFDRIGKYEILAKIGQGAMGEVYRGRDPLLNRSVAIKTISANFEADSDLRKRFLREAQAVAHLNHPNIITVYDLGEEHGRIYMAMELLEGRDLKELIATHDLGDLEWRLDILQQVCEGLAFAHAKNIIHRDLKPAHIHIQPKGHVKILDFGLARVGSSEMTKTGMVLGTPHYMSPEQVRGERVDARSDIFSLGAVLYEVLAEHKPFEGDSMHTIMYKVLQEAPEPIRNCVDVPLGLCELVEKALRKSPAERFQDAGEIARGIGAVRAALAGGEGDAIKPRRGPEATLDGSPTPRPTPLPSSRSGSERRLASHGAPPGGRERRVVGAVALQPAAPESVEPPSATLSGRAATDAGSTGRALPSTRGLSHPVGYFVGGALGMAAVIVAAFLATRSQGTAPATSSPEPERQQIGALTEALVANEVELSRRKLEDKNYRGASAQAERALKLDPGNAEAKKILEEAQATLGTLRAASEEFRSGLKDGDSQRASDALLKVLSIDPYDPVANEPLSPLNPHLRRGAEEARKAVAEARRAAEQAKATSLDTFREAVALSAQGETLAAKGEFAAAARKFFEARDSFDRARRTARR